MSKAGVPVVPGYHGDEQGLDFLKEEADRIGYPILVKPSHGGGGKVQSQDSFEFLEKCVLVQVDCWILFFSIFKLLRIF
jgi:acetyl/propionyl-CoA carboxylase alpha subunit